MMSPVGIRLSPLIGLTLVLCACATSSQLVTGARRAPVAPASVRVYTQAPEHFEEIAELGASRNSISSAGGERAIARMIESMRSQAAKLGANGLLLEDFSDANGVSLGTGLGTQTYTHNADISLGVSGSLGVVKKVAKARAIFVAPRSS
jgi:hypothetical protein